ncbi:MAG: hypothetical protein Q8Q31_04990 [Nanoarchaeota archaeon]|nr:hypothetical protein [Nanoarchaeota archaeon]
MGTASLLLTLDSTVLRDLKKKAKKLHYESTQQYVYEIIRRNVYPNRKGNGKKTSDQEIMDKFSTSTKQSRKIERWANKYGL